MNSQLESIICNTAEKFSKYDLTLGYLRYEVLRKLRPHDFERLNARNLHGENFDGMIDELVIKNYENKI